MGYNMGQLGIQRQYRGSDPKAEHEVGDRDADEASCNEEASWQIRVLRLRSIFQLQLDQHLCTDCDQTMCENCYRERKRSNR